MSKTQRPKLQYKGIYNMTISKQELSRLIAETQEEYIMPSYLEKWQGICAIHQYGICLTEKQMGIIVTVNDHSNRRKVEANPPDARQLNLPV